MLGYDNCQNSYEGNPPQVATTQNLTPFAYKYIDFIHVDITWP